MQYTLYRDVCLFGLPTLPDEAALKDLLHRAEIADSKPSVLLLGSGLIETAREWYAYGIKRIFVYETANPSEKELSAILTHYAELHHPGTFIVQDEKALRIAQDAAFDSETEILYLPYSSVSAVSGAAVPGELIICEVQ